MCNIKHAMQFALHLESQRELLKDGKDGICYFERLIGCMDARRQDAGNTVLNATMEMGKDFQDGGMETCFQKTV